MPPLVSSHVPRLVGLAALIAFAPPVPANAWQNGDQAGEAQPARDHDFEVPAAPVLTPDEALASFELPAGYHIELAAGDAVLDDPVDIAFDEYGRMWVVEMKGFMPDADGHGELDAVGSIATLTDTDGDGVYETRTTFADALVLPRGLTLAYGGVVAVLPPRLVWMGDRDGDGRCDLVETIDEGGAFDVGLTSPEHAPNAPMLGLDNWLYLGNHKWRYRLVGAEWQREEVPVRGQWGLDEDVFGRAVYNYNSTPIRGDRVPPHYLVRNPALGLANGSNGALATDTAVWSTRLNTGINRGYRDGNLRSDGTLKNYTAACGAGFFTGTALAPLDTNDVFVAEPAANLVRHNRMHESAGRLAGENAHGRHDFLTSTDERFRPVSIEDGPDGALYVVDLYRGILQHRVFLTSFLRRQIEERGLDKPIGLGRIWRVRHDDGVLSTGMSLGELGADDLVLALSSENGWARRTAQRLLIQRGARGATTIAALEKLARNDEATALGRLHALWTLEGLGRLSDDVLASGLENETEPHVLASLVRLSETRTDKRHIAAWMRLATSDEPLIRWQIAHSLGVRPVPSPGLYDGPTFYVDPLVLAPVLLQGRDDDAVLRHGLLSGLAGRELDLAEALDPLLGSGGEASPQSPFASTFSDIGFCIGRRGDPSEVARLFDHAILPATATDSRPRSAAAPLLKGLLRGTLDRKAGIDSGPRPASLTQLLTSESQTWGELRALAIALDQALQYGAPPSTAPDEDPATIKLRSESIAHGKLVFARNCAACHQADGSGLIGVAPPLTDQVWLSKSDDELAGIIVGGLSGKIEVAGKQWDLAMPSWRLLSNKDLASVLTYVLASHGKDGNEKRIIAPATIQAAR